MRRLIPIALLVALTAPGCLVLGLDRFYDEASIVFDERLLGTWKNADDNVTVTVEKSDWRAFRIQYVHTIDTRVLTAYLFKVREAYFLDLSPLRGEDPGPFLLPAHTVVRLVFGAGEIRISPLDFDWFSRALEAKTLPAELRASLGERNQVVLAADRNALVRWLAARPENDPAFGDAAIFRKNPER